MKGNELLPGIFAVDLALWVQEDRALVIADLHLGIEEMYNKQGVLLPRHNFADIKKRLEKRVFAKVKPELIVINGDLKHEFGSISEQEWKEVIGMLRFLQKYCKKIVLVKGNHDKILGPIAQWEGIEIVDEGILLPKAGVFVTHGERIPETGEFEKARVVVIGHEHPAVKIRERYKHEQFKCFLVGKWKFKKLVVQPSLSAVSLGTDIRQEKVLSPFLKQELEHFKVFAVADKVYGFGELRGLE